jgi:hypothetical protein
MAARAAIFSLQTNAPLIDTAFPCRDNGRKTMNYWSELGWMVLPMSGIEIGFAILMCFISQRIDNNNK